MENTLSQGGVLLTSIYAGILMGAFYDICYIIRQFHESKWLDAIMDTLFWAGAFVIAAYTLLQTNGLRVRLFVLFGFAVGFSAYKFTLSCLIIKFFHWIKRKLLTAFAAIAKYIK